MLFRSHTYYLVMEYLDGADLKRVLRDRGPVSPGETASITLQVAEALAYAHAQGVIHRDIKPGNVLLTPDGRVKVGDFGIAAARDEMTLTTTGDLLGTLEYMAPEQFEHGPLDGRVDLYALGILMTTLLMGASPYQGLHRTVLLARLASPEPHPIALPPSVPRPLQAIVRRLIQRDPAARYQRANELAHDLEPLTRHRASEGAVAPTRSVVVEEAKAVRPAAAGPRRPTRAWALPRLPALRRTVAATLLMGLAVGLVLLLRGSGDDRQGQFVTRLRDVKNELELVHARMKAAREGALAAAADRSAAALYQTGLASEAQAERARQEASTLIAVSQHEQAIRGLERATVSYRAAEQAYQKALEGSSRPASLGRMAGPPAAPAAPSPRVAAREPIPKPAPGPLDDADVDTVNGLVERVRLAVAGHDLASVRQAVRLSPSSERLLIEVFRAYQSLQLIVERIDLTPDTATAVLAFDRLINQAGQQAVPGDTWRQATLRAVKRNGNWDMPTWEERTPGASRTPGPPPSP